MSKEESLAFINSCIAKVETASDEELDKWVELYKKHCSTPIESSNFEFVPPAEFASPIVNTSVDVNMSSYVDKLLEANKPNWKFNGISGNWTESEKHMKTVTYAA